MASDTKTTVAVLGASPKPKRYSNQAVRLLKENHYEVIPVNPYFSEIEGLRCVHDIKSLPAALDTITVYINPGRLTPLLDDLISLKPRRVILNPGTESETVKQKLAENNINTLAACTLVMLRTGQF